MKIDTAGEWRTWQHPVELKAGDRLSVRFTTAFPLAVELFTIGIHTPGVKQLLFYTGELTFIGGGDGEYQCFEGLCSEWFQMGGLFGNDFQIVLIAPPDGQYFIGLVAIQPVEVTVTAWKYPAIPIWGQ